MKEIVILTFGIGLGVYIKTLRDRNKELQAAKPAGNCSCKV